MQLKRLLSLLLSIVLLFSLAACGGNETASKAPGSDKPSSSAESEADKAPATSDEVKYVTNPLTGENTLNSRAEGRRPTAITVNNIYVAQSVQSGLDKADVVFETEVEGGITRLLALFSDPTDVGKIGTVRSMRVVFAEIASGMNAMLFYHGIDYKYCYPMLSTLSTPHYELHDGVYAAREKNGLAVEHTLYSNGASLVKAASDRKFNTKGAKTWLNFADTAEKTAPSSDKAEKVKVKFNGTSITNFYYDAQAKKYTRANRNGTNFKTYHTGQEEKFSNIFVLKTTIRDYPDGKHREVVLSSGSGWYISAGGCTEINWKKGAASNNFVFTKTDGSDLTVNQGNSYVCIINNSGSLTCE